MKIKEGYTLHNIANEAILVPTDENIGNDCISLDPVSADQWVAMKEKTSFCIEELTETIMSIYEVDRDTAHEDSIAIAETWLEMNIAEL